MELTNDFEVPVALERAWELLTDLERIAPCLPGAQLTSVDGDTYHGTVTVKVGPIVATYEGTAKFRELDESSRRVVLDAAGRDRRQGKASATITATMEAAPGGGTRVSLATDLTISGKVAQFGRGVLADVSEKLLGEFVTNLEHDVLGASGPKGGGAPEEPADAAAPVPDAVGEPSEAGERTVRHFDAGPVAPVDLLDAAGTPLLKRILPIIGVFVALLAFRRLLRGTKGIPDVDVLELTGLPVGPGLRPSCELAPVSGVDGEHATVAALLGREPQSAYDVVVRDATGAPLVLRNAPLLDNGTPMPTRFWLLPGAIATAIGRLEAAGGVRRAEADVDPAELRAAHDRYAAERDAAMPADHVGPRPSGGVGGTRTGVKCLHAHYAWYLAGGDDPIGAWTQRQLDGEHAGGGR